MRPSNTSSMITVTNNDDSLVKYGGLVPDNETNKVEEAGTQQGKLAIVIICIHKGDLN